MNGTPARVWEEDVIIPTYAVGEPDPNPMFLEKRVYQGSSGAVYPFPVIDKVSDEKTDRKWHAVFLENRYLKIMTLPQIGGRIHMILDKTNGFHCIYYQHVIKPALVGLAGPWCSGGIEFNWPQHHRPSTFMPIEHTLRQNSDGSATVWMSEIDRMYGTRMMAGFTLYPDKAYLEIDVRLFNRTPLPQSFLWWANPAVHVNEHHQSVFPPDVHAVMDHGKRDVSSFPIATGTYYKVNYAPGTDISRYKNIPVPTSYMAYRSEFDFMASYDHGRRAGLLHVADHHVSPGKKQWTWGCGDFGKAWDRRLTDEDGPYVEMMCGVFTDNQPDFSWMGPYEQKAFKQHFMPYKTIGRIKNATIEAAINLEMQDNQTAYVAAYVTSQRNGLELVLRDEATEKVVFAKGDQHFSPEKAFEQIVSVPHVMNSDQLRLSLLDATGRTVVSYKQVKVTTSLPSPAQAALPPEKIPSTDQLYLTGIHLEQYRHATYSPEPYYREALRRDPGDVRSNNALGLLLYRRGDFAEAEKHFRIAIATLTQRNPHPCDSEPYFNLGLTLKMQGRFAEAFDAFYRATWSAHQQAAAYFSLAQVASILGRTAEAIELTDRAIELNGTNPKARVLKAALLRVSGRTDEARAAAQVVHESDILDFGALYELGESHREELTRALRSEAHNYIELALDYAAAGLYESALDVLKRYQETHGENPMPWYLAGWISELQGQRQEAMECFRNTAKRTPRPCFPNQLEEMLALQSARRLNPDDPMAAYLLGNLLYDKRAYDRAIEAWEDARRLQPDFPTVHRNLALAYHNKRGNPSAAQESLETAFALHPTDARVLFELDQLYRQTNRSPKDRLALLEQHEKLVCDRDDLYLERVNLLLLGARFEESRRLLAARNFHPWEGGEGKVSGAYVQALVGLAKRHLEQRQFEQAISLLDAARVYPQNLGEGKLPVAMENHLDYFSGIAMRGLGPPPQAREFFERAAQGCDEPTPAIYYNDQPPDMILYQGLALRELGRDADAEARFNKLIRYGREHLNDTPTIDYFAVSLPTFGVFDDDLKRRNRVHCQYLLALGYLGLLQFDDAREALEAVLREDAAHLGATTHLQMLDTASSKVEHTTAERT